MVEFIVALIISALAVLVSAYIIPGVSVNSFLTALLVAVVLGVLNALVRPVLTALTLPINILTLGLFSFVITAVIVWIAAAVVPGFAVDGFLSAMLFGILTALIVAAVDYIV